MIPWSAVCQAPLSMEFSRKEYWSGLPFPTPGDTPNPGIEPVSLASLALGGEPSDKQQVTVKVKVKSLSHVRLFVTPMDSSLPGSAIYGIFQARILKWAAISFFRGSSQPLKTHKKFNRIPKFYS